MSFMVHSRVEHFVVDQSELQTKLHELYPQAVVDQQVVDILKSNQPISYLSCLEEYQSRKHDRSAKLILADFAKSCLAAGKTHKAFAYFTDAIRHDTRERFLPGIPDKIKECLECSEIIGRLLGTKNLCAIYLNCSQKSSKI